MYLTPKYCLSRFIFFSAVNIADFSHANEAGHSAFDECPSYGYLVQNSNADLYSVNLLTGQSTLQESNIGTNKKFNALGFNQFDKHFYGWDYKHKTIGKIGKDYQINLLPLDNSQVMQSDGINIASKNYFVGDVSTQDNVYYFYKKNLGLFRVNLDPEASNYLVTETVTTDASMKIYDMAFHPTSGLAFAVDNAGLLWKINVNDVNQTENLGSIGQTGIFGAAYFDRDGFLYLSRNSDGHIFRIDINNIYSESRIDIDSLTPAIDGESRFHKHFPSEDYSENVNIKGTKHNDALIINGDLLVSGARYNGGQGYDRLILGQASNYYTVTKKGKGFKIGWPNGNFLKIKNVEQILYSNFLSTSPSSDFFANGPVSASNDGARCAVAKILDDQDASVDFGDAPDSYSSSLLSNGPRHGVDHNGLFLGMTVNGENGPRSDSDSSDDGIAFVTTLEIGLDAIIDVEASASGYVHGWIDFDQNGVFDQETESILSGQFVNAGTNTFVVSIPSESIAGSTWSRFRIASSSDILPIGGEPDGEVEDYAVTLDRTDMTRIFYPGSSTYVTLAYEDFWPKYGDFDFNDVVVRYRTIEDRVDQKVVSYTVQGFLDASGAIYHNGFAVRFLGIDKNNVDTDAIRFKVSGESQIHSPLATQYNDAVLYIFADIRALYTQTESCSVFRTQAGCEDMRPISFSVTLPLKTPVSVNSAPSGLMDPFIFSVAGRAHGDVSSEQADGWEVHMKNHAPTSAFKYELLGESDDNSFGLNYFQSENGLPWALEIQSSWLYPLEQVSINEAYPDFISFAKTNGHSHNQWINNYKVNKIFNEGE